MIHSILHVLWENHLDWALGSLGGDLLSMLLIFLSVLSLREKNMPLVPVWRPWS